MFKGCNTHARALALLNIYGYLWDFMMIVLFGKQITLTKLITKFRYKIFIFLTIKKLVLIISEDNWVLTSHIRYCC